MAKLINRITQAKTRTLLLAVGMMLVVGIVIVSLNLNEEEDDLQNRESSTSGVPGNITSSIGDKSSENYTKLQIEDNKNRSIKAIKEGSSSIPTIVNNGKKEPTKKKPQDKPENLESQIYKTFPEESSQLDEESQIELKKLKAELSADEPKNEWEKLVEEQRKLEQQDLIEQQKQLELQRVAELNQAELEAIGNISSNMENQLNANLAEAEAFVPQQFIVGDVAEENADGSENEDEEADNLQTLFKAGTILYAVLDTAINTDEPSPIMATVVHGNFEGTKLMGKLTIPENGKKVILDFGSMNIAALPNTLPVKAVAIDTETARTALASSVNNHYLVRYGSLFASAFMEGYSKIIGDKGKKTTVTTNSDGSSVSTTEVPQDITGKQEVFSGLSKVGEKWSEAVSGNFDRKPTIKVHAGTSIGLLFLDDVKFKPN